MFATKAVGNRISLNYIKKLYSPAVSIIKKIASSHKIVMAVGAGGLEIPPGLVPRGASLSAVSASSAQRPLFAPHSPRQTHWNKHKCNIFSMKIVHKQKHICHIIYFLTIYIKCIYLPLNTNYLKKRVRSLIKISCFRFDPVWQNSHYLSDVYKTKWNQQLISYCPGRV